MCTNLLVKGGRIVDCKQCDECRKIEAWRWTQRIRVESALVKTWFCTFTYKGEIEVGYSELQKMFKRLRKNYQFRYLCVSERGSKNDRLHYHAVIHGELTRREVESEWKFGFSNAKLSGDASKYISKYMSKAKSEVGGKFYRASIGYGTKPLGEKINDNDLVKAVFERFPNARVIGLNDIKIPYKHQIKLDTETKNKFISINALRRDGT